jgi:hypothetical protein
MKLLAFISTVTATSLCGNWAQLQQGKCSLSNKCCQSSGTPIPSCLSPLREDTLSIVSQETYKFAGDLKYGVELIIATGNSCPLTYYSGTSLFVTATEGAYVSLGDNNVLGNGWQKVQYTPQRFITSIIKNNQASFFTNGVPFGVGGLDLIGPCVEMRTYLNDPNVGCPCNGTWTNSAFANGATNTSATRVINATSCPLINGTNSSCPESFFFNTNLKYGSIRITNQTNSTNGTYRLLEITQPLFNSTLGWNNSVVYANFTADLTCPATLVSDSLAPTAAQSPAARVACNAVPFLLAIWIFVFVR